MMWKHWFAWYPIKLENNDYAKISGNTRWVWLCMIYKRQIYKSYPGMLYQLSFNVYSDLIQ